MQLSSLNEPGVLKYMYIYLNITIRVGRYLLIERVIFKVIADYYLPLLDKHKRCSSILRTPGYSISLLGLKTLS